MAVTERQPKFATMNGMSHPHGRATISTGGAANCVSVPPIETLTNNTPSVAYFSRVEGCKSKNCRASRSAQIVIAAGSVINEDVPDGALGIARPKQTNVEGYADRVEEDSE